MDNPKKTISEITRKNQVEIIKELNSSDKSFVAIGTRNDIKVIVKVLISQENTWKAKFAHEILIHDLFNKEIIPFKFAKSLFSGDNWLIIEYIQGKEILADRYPDNILSQELVRNILNLSALISSWDCKNKKILKIWGYEKKLEKYYERGFISSEEKNILNDLLPAYIKELEFNHGDLLLSNIMINSSNEYIPIDWEFAGLFIPGFDLALLHTILIKNDYARKSIEKIIYSKNMNIPFLINKVFIMIREIKIHQELPNNISFKNERLSFLEPEWENIRQKLKNL